MTLDYLQNLTMADIDNMSQAELKSALQYGKKILINRYKKQKAVFGDVAPVFKGEKGKNSPYRIKTTNLTRDQMVNRLIRVQTRTKATTTTISGYKHWRKTQARLFNERKELTEEEYKTIYDAYDRLKQLNPSLFQTIDYNKIIKRITSYVDKHIRISEKNIFKDIKKLAEEDNPLSKAYAENEWQDLVDDREEE